jgi:hypothetical protein
MATSNKTEEQILQERAVKALESISTSLGDINDWFYELNSDLWQERLEWYLNEFYQIAKAKTVGDTNRPERARERTQTDIDIDTESSES